MKGRRHTVAALGLAAVAIAGCASSGVRVTRSDRHRADTPPITTVPDPDPPRTEPLAWSACADYPAPWECGTVDVPVDYAHPAGDHLSIAMIRLRAADPTRRVGSLLLNPGGPGGSGID